jgi:hypothetical protein
MLATPSRLRTAHYLTPIRYFKIFAALMKSSDWASIIRQRERKNLEIEAKA